MARVHVHAKHALHGHRDKVWSLAFSPDGRTLASAGEDRTIVLWNLGEMRAPRSFLGHLGGVTSVAFSPAGGLLASGGEDGTVRVWNLTNSHGWTMRRQRGGVNQVAFSPHGRLVAAAGGIYGRPGVVKLWDLESRRERASFAGHENEVMTVAFSPSGRFLLTGDFAGVIKLWDISGNQQRMSLTAHLGVVWKVEFVDDDCVLLSAGEDGTFRFWMAPTGRPLAQVPGDHFGVLSFARAGQRLVAGRHDGELQLWNSAAARQGARLGNHGCAVFAVAISSDGGLVASAGADGAIRLWEIIESSRHVRWGRRKQPSPCLPA